MPPLPRGRCPDCKQIVALRVGGQVREHRVRIGPKLAGEKCTGSGKQAAS